MLILLEEQAAKNAAQAALEKSLKSYLPYQGEKAVGFQGGNKIESLYSHGEGQLWCVLTTVDDVPIPRTWNAFGIYQAKRRMQSITVEINIPTENNSAQVAGFFAKDLSTDRVCLMHNGRIGGGKLGIGQKAFLSQSLVALKEVSVANGTSRLGIAIGFVDDPDLANKISRFVKIVQDFKENGLEIQPDLPVQTEGWKSLLYMASQAEQTAKSSNGQIVGSVRKNKEMPISRQDLERHLGALLELQQSRCAITGIALQFIGASTDFARLASLDRIDSNGPYDVGNLQIVCRFINGWKSDTTDLEFRRQLELVMNQDRNR